MDEITEERKNLCKAAGDSFWSAVTPESIGIPSKAVMNFIHELEMEHICMHGFIMIKEGKVFSEGYYSPFDADFQHRMYSVSKSFTSLAIGFLQEEGKLSINDRICDYFPDKFPEDGPHPYLAMTTIKDMLKMTTPYRFTTFKQMDIDDWVKTFFVVKADRYPGTSFNYDTSASHVLAALVERISGKSLIEYLRDKLLKHLGCSEGMKVLPDPVGVSQGGSGLICTLRDLAKVAYTCLNNGVYQGRQLIPQKYLKEATANQISTCLQPVIEEQQGYGYQFWRCRNNGFAMYGIGGQLAICLPDYDFLLATTADTLGNPNGVQSIYEALWHQILPYLTSKKQMALPENPVMQKELQHMISELTVKTVIGNYSCDIAYQVKEKVYLLTENPMQISECSLSFLENKMEGSFDYVNNTGKHKVEFGFGHMVKQKFPDTDCDCISSAAWILENILHLRIYIIDEVFSSVNITFTFVGNTITLAMKKGIEPFLNQYEGFASGETDTAGF